MFIFKLSLLLLTILGSLSCNKSENNSKSLDRKNATSSDNIDEKVFRLNDPMSKPFLSLEDFKAAPSTFDTFSEQDFIDRLHTDFGKVTQVDGTGGKKAEEKNCFDDLFSSSKAKATGDRMVLEISGDFTDCAGTDSQWNGLTTQVIQRIYYEVFCEGVDFASLDGKNPLKTNPDGSYSFLEECSNAKKVSILSNQTTTIKLSSSDGKTDFTKDFVSSLQNEDGKPCEHDGKNYTSGCLTLQKEIMKGKIVPQGTQQIEAGGSEIIYPSYDSLVVSSMSIEAGTKYYATCDNCYDGIVKFSVNGWDAKVDFTASPATWTAKNLENVNLSGKFKP